MNTVYRVVKICQLILYSKYSIYQIKPSESQGTQSCIIVMNLCWGRMELNQGKANNIKKETLLKEQ